MSHVLEDLVAERDYLLADGATGTTMMGGTPKEAPGSAAIEAALGPIKPPGAESDPGEPKRGKRRSRRAR